IGPEAEAGDGLHVRERAQLEAGDLGRHGETRRGEDAGAALAAAVEVAVFFERNRQLAMPLRNAASCIAHEHVVRADRAWKTASGETLRDGDEIAVGNARREISPEIDHLVMG